MAKNDDAFRFAVRVDNYEGGKLNQTVTLEPSPQTAALVEAGVLEPLSKAAASAVEDVPES